mgnify:CR=1 FL=1
MSNKHFLFEGNSVLPHRPVGVLQDRGARGGRRYRHRRRARQEEEEGGRRYSRRGRCCLLLGDPEVTANIYCKSRNLPNTDTQNYSTNLR